MGAIVYFSGTHGVGKSTTINEVAARCDLPVYFSSEGDHGNPYKDYFKRQVWRLNKYYLDALEIHEQAESLDKPLLVDRCIHDHHCYTNTFHDLGNLSDEEHGVIERMRSALFSGSRVKPQHIVYLAPPLDWTKERIVSRWNDEKKKWREDDFGYLEVLRTRYDNLYAALENYGLVNVLTLRDTDLDTRVNCVFDFIASLKNRS